MPGRRVKTRPDVLAVAIVESRLMNPSGVSAVSGCPETSRATTDNCAGFPGAMSSPVFGSGCVIAIEATKSGAVEALDPHPPRVATLATAAAPLKTRPNTVTPSPTRSPSTPVFYRTTATQRLLRDVDLGFNRRARCGGDVMSYYELGPAQRRRIDRGKRSQRR